MRAQFPTQKSSFYHQSQQLDYQNKELIYQQLVESHKQSNILQGQKLQQLQLLLIDQSLRQEKLGSLQIRAIKHLNRISNNQTKRTSNNIYEFLNFNKKLIRHLQVKNKKNEHLLIDNIKKLYEESQINHKSEIEYLTQQKLYTQLNFNILMIKYSTQLHKQKNNQSIGTQKIKLLSLQLKWKLTKKINQFNSQIISKENVIEILEFNASKLKNNFRRFYQQEQQERNIFILNQDEKTIEQYTFILEQKRTIIIITRQYKIEIDNITLRLDSATQKIDYYLIESNQLQKYRNILQIELEMQNKIIQKYQKKFIYLIIYLQIKIKQLRNLNLIIINNQFLFNKTSTMNFYQKMIYLNKLNLNFNLIQIR
ncbi:unnamed protein product [Paramecium pentaurelia]|uniref:Uncharacterized protein n=1 Tax=Paramecium pentaurelia TaxID=43138 RepID=A0A8S1X1Y3_9CILI|nr:unnamed protein product [Paramecium pentaurelia]